MSECLFVIKSILITAVLIMVMQVKMGSSTLEDRAYFFIHDSGLGNTFSGVASGLVKSGHDGIQHIKSTLGFPTESKIVSHAKSRLKFEVDRSKEYLDRKRAAEADND